MKNNLQGYVRRIQQTGGSTFIVSLPREWVAELGLKKFDEIILIPLEDGSLHVIPHHTSKEGNHNEFVVHVQRDETPDNVFRDYVSAYLAGYNTIKIVFKETSARLAHEIRRLIRRWLIGVEVIEESFNEIVTQCLPMHNNLPVRRAVERMANIASLMQRDAISLLDSRNRDVALEIVERDDEVDRFYHFIVRQLNLASSNPLVLNSLGLRDRQDCIGYMLVTKSIERAADHASNIAKTAVSLTEYRNVVLSRIADIGYEANNLFNNSVKALLNDDKEAAKQVITKTTYIVKQTDSLHLRILERIKNPVVIMACGMILENIRRIAEYSSDISEVAVNLSITKPRIDIL